MWQLCILSSVILQIVCGKLIGDHVCLIEESYTVNVTDFVLRNVTLRDYKWCMNIPPRCSYYITKQIKDKKMVERNHTVTVEKCCPGYSEINNECVSSCGNCENGNCYGDVCICSPGFSGNHCNSSCEPGFWGPNCTRECNCGDLPCDPINGNCTNETLIILGTSESNISKEIVTKRYEATSSYTETDKFSQSNYSTMATTTEVVGQAKSPDIYDQYFKPSKEQEGTKIIEVDISSTPHAISGPGQTSSVPYSSTNIPILQNILQPVTTFTTTASVEEIQPNVNKDLLSLEKVNHDKAEKPPLQKEDIIDLGISKEKKYLVAQNNAENTHSLPDDKNLVNSVTISTAVTTALVLLAIIVTLISQMRKSRRKENESTSKKNVGVSTVSVYTTSIFHTPLPDPPTFENPSYLVPMEYQNSTAEPKIFEAHVITNVNTQCQPKPSYRDYIYDHPPSTGSYRAASTVDPLDGDMNRSSSFIQSEPLYDEIPCRNGCEQVDEGISYYSQPRSLYINTCNKTKL